MLRVLRHNTDPAGRAPIPTGWALTAWRPARLVGGASCPEGAVGSAKVYYYLIIV